MHLSAHMFMRMSMHKSEIIREFGVYTWSRVRLYVQEIVEVLEPGGDIPDWMKNLGSPGNMCMDICVIGMCSHMFIDLPLQGGPAAAHSSRPQARAHPIFRTIKTTRTFTMPMFWGCQIGPRVHRTLSARE